MCTQHDRQNNKILFRGLRKKRSSSSRDLSCNTFEYLISYLTKLELSPHLPPFRNVEGPEAETR